LQLFLSNEHIQKKKKKNGKSGSWKENGHCSFSLFLEWGMAPGDIAAPFQSPRGGISPPATGSSIQEEVPRERTTDTSIWTGDRGKDPTSGHLQVVGEGKKMP
jgi:hypothetical protein